MATLEEKEASLRAYLAARKPLAVAFSGGVDSTLLLYLAVQACGAENILAVTAATPFFPLRERQEAIDFAKSLGVRHLVVETDEMSIPGFAENPPDRCYLCKKHLFSGMMETAAAAGFPSVCEGSNMDDNGDYRPGLTAIAELGVLSPLRAAGLCKSEIRALSRKYDLPTWSKPSFACLASRFVYGETITKEKLSRVEKAEDFLRDAGFSQVRVRIHGAAGDLARIEVSPEDISRFADDTLREAVTAAAKAAGFRYVTLDLQGYRVGAMNEALDQTTLSRGFH